MVDHVVDTGVDVAWLSFMRIYSEESGGIQTLYPLHEPL
jgi:hypothetical protein